LPSSAFSSPETSPEDIDEPLDVAGAKVFLVGHGYAPSFIVRDSTGAVVFDDAVVFLPQDGKFTSKPYRYIRVTD